MGKLVDEPRIASSDDETNVDANLSSSSVYLDDGNEKPADFLTWEKRSSPTVHLRGLPMDHRGQDGWLRPFSALATRVEG